MKKDTVILIAILLLLLIAGFFSGFMYLSKINETPSDDSKNNEQQNIGDLTYEIKTYAEDNKELSYKVEIKYPEFSGFENDAVKNTVNEDIKNSAFRAADEFKKNASCVIEINPDIQPCEFIAGFDDFEVVDGKLLSLAMAYYQYTQGAHGATITVFLNYDIATGKMVAVKDLFKKNSNYLNIIAAYSKKALEKRNISDSEWIEDGTQPNQENYNTNIGFSGDGLVVVFQQYQVAAYAAGPQTLVVPYAELTTVIDSKGLLGEFTK